MHSQTAHQESKCEEIICDLCCYESTVHSGKGSFTAVYVGPVACFTNASGPLHLSAKCFTFLKPYPPWHLHSAPLTFTVLNTSSTTCPQKNPWTRYIMWDHKADVSVTHRIWNASLLSTKLTLRISFMCWIIQTLSSISVIFHWFISNPHIEVCLMDLRKYLGYINL